MDNAISQPNVSIPMVSGFGTRIARRAFEAHLRSMDTGSLTVRTGDSAEAFGDPAAGPSAAMTVSDPRFFRRAVLGGPLGFAEAYVDGLWDSDDLAGVLRSFAQNISITHRAQRGVGRIAVPLRRIAHRLNANTRSGSKKNIEAHYDLGNDFFALMLDETMTYSAGIFETPASTLEQASTAKLDRICKKLALTPDDRVVEIGTGWGSFALHAAANYGCHVTTTTISPSQHEWAQRRVREEGLEDRVTLLLQDYRDLSLERAGSFDKLVSIEMIEAVGHDFLPAYFEACSRLLKPEGSMLIQAISMPDRRYEVYRKSMDFIQKHVFPGSCCPSLTAILDAMGRGSDLRVAHLEDITPHYATTLARWRERFDERIEDVRALGYPPRFERLWRFYLAYCEVGFAERYIGTSQIVFDKPLARPAPILPALGVPAAQARTTAAQSEEPATC